MAKKHHNSRRKELEPIMTALKEKFAAKLGTTKSGIRYNLEFAREIFSTLGHTLLADSFSSSAVKMPFICKCGRRHEAALHNIMNGNQCPECGKDEYNRKRAMPVLRNLARRMYASIKVRVAKKKHYTDRGIKCLFTEEEFLTWAIPELRKYLEEKGLLQDVEGRRGSPLHVRSGASVDRIDADGHYELGNVRIIDKELNALRAVLARMIRTDKQNGIADFATVVVETCNAVGMEVIHFCNLVMDARTKKL